MSKVIRACVTLTEEEIEAADKQADKLGITRAALLGALICANAPKKDRDKIADSRKGRGRPSDD